MKLKVLDEYPRSFPPKKYYVQPQALEAVQAIALEQLIETNAGETEVDQFLRKHPALLAACMNFTQFGHHGTWVVPQQLVRPPSDVRGLKPDYIVGGKGSDGYSWYVIELKSPADKIFSGRLSLSSVANYGINQLLQYTDYCSHAQSYLRDTVKLKGFREPKGFLIIGRESEVEKDQERQDLKAAHNRNAHGIQIRTFDALIRSNSSTWFTEKHPRMRNP